MDGDDPVVSAAGSGRGGPVCWTVQSRASDPVTAADEVADRLAGRDLALVIVYCSSRFSLDAVASALTARLDSVAVVGSTTAGEIGPRGYLDGSIVAVGLSAAYFSAAVTHLRDLGAFDEVGAREEAARMVGTIGAPSDRCFSLLLVDGLSGREERVARQCQRALGDVPLVGGSAGDDQAFRATHVLHDGRFRAGAVWLLISTRLPFTVFRSSHFIGVGDPLVVTEADADRRVVREINGYPAAVAYAAALGLAPGDLDAGELTSAPLAVRIGGTDYVRSIRSVNDDSSLSLYCAIERGVVLRVASGSDLLGARRDLFHDVAERIGPPELVLGFDCIHCKLEADGIDGRRSVERLFADNAVLGFSSYGEQFVGTHVNQTFTGVAIGGPPS